MFYLHTADRLSPTKFAFRCAHLHNIGTHNNTAACVHACVFSDDVSFRVPGVTSAEVSLPLERATVCYDSAIISSEQVSDTSAFHPQSFVRTVHVSRALYMPFCVEVRQWLMALTVPVKVPRPTLEVVGYTATSVTARTKSLCYCCLRPWRVLPRKTPCSSLKITFF